MEKKIVKKRQKRKFMEALERIKKGKWKEKNGNGGVESSKLHKRSASIINTESTLFSTDGSRITAVNSRQVRNCKKNIAAMIYCHAKSRKLLIYWVKLKIFQLFGVELMNFEHSLI